MVSVLVPFSELGPKSLGFRVQGLGYAGSFPMGINDNLSRIATERASEREREREREGKVIHHLGVRVHYCGCSGGPWDLVIM